MTKLLKSGNTAIDSTQPTNLAVRKSNPGWGRDIPTEILLQVAARVADDPASYDAMLNTCTLWRHHLGAQAELHTVLTLNLPASSIPAQPQHMAARLHQQALAQRAFEAGIVETSDVATPAKARLIGRQRDLAIFAHGERIEMWNYSRPNKAMRTWQHPGASAWLTGAASKDGSVAIVGDTNGWPLTVMLSRFGANPSTSTRESFYLTAVGMSEDGSYAAWAQDGGRGSVTLWDTQRDETFTLTTQLNATRLFFSRNSKRLVAVGEHAMIWDLPATKTVRVALGGTNAAALSPSGRWLATAEGHQARPKVTVWDLRNDAVVAYPVELPQGGPRGIPTFSHDDRYMAMGCFDGVFVVKNLGRENESTQMLAYAGKLQWEKHLVDFSPAGSTRLVTATDHLNMWRVGHKGNFERVGNSRKIAGTGATGTALFSSDGFNVSAAVKDTLLSKIYPHRLRQFTFLWDTSLGTSSLIRK